MITWLDILKDWAPLITLVAAISTFILAIAAFFQIRRSREQIIEQEKTRSANLILKSFEISEAVRFDKDEDYDKLKNMHYSKWDDASNMLAIRLTGQFERISYLAIKGFVNMDAMIDLHGSMINLYWDIFKDFIYFMRGKRSNSDTNVDKRYEYRKYFELFAIECRKYLDK